MSMPNRARHGQRRHERKLTRCNRVPSTLPSLPSEKDKRNWDSVPTQNIVQNDYRLESYRLDELSEDHLKVYAENCWLISLMQTGVSAKEAIRRVGSGRSERSARRLLERFKRRGHEGLLDKRWFRKTRLRVFTSEVKEIALSWYFARPAAGPRAIWKKTCEECRRQGIKEPCETSVKTFLDNLDESLKLFRKGKAGIREWEQDAKPVIRFENTKYANQLWQGDHSPLPIWVKVKVSSVWKPFQVYITLLLDAHTRAVPGYVVSTNYPNSWTIALTFRRAILPKEGKSCNICGIPTIFESDRGKDFLCAAVVATLKELGGDPRPDPPRYPNMKGKVERVFKSLDSGCLCLLPGHMRAVGTSKGAALKRVHEFLTLQQLDQEIARWIDEEYHQREHSETRRAPAEFWEDTKLLRLPESEDKLNLLILKYDKECTVINTGIKFSLNGVRHRYWSPELATHWKRVVRLRYNPDDMESVLVYCAATGEYLCEAFNMLSDTPRYTIEDIKRTRSQWRRGLLERTRGYMETVYEDDRKKAEREEREEARRFAAKMLAENAEIPSDTDDAQVEGFLTLFKQQDRNKS